MIPQPRQFVQWVFITATLLSSVGCVTDQQAPTDAGINTVNDAAVIVEPGEPLSIINPIEEWMQQVVNAAQPDERQQQVVVTDSDATTDATTATAQPITEPINEPAQEPPSFVGVPPQPTTVVTGTSSTPVNSADSQDEPQKQSPRTPSSKRRVASPQQPLGAPTNPATPQVTVTLIILGPAGQQVYPVSLPDGSTVEDAMVAAQQQGLIMELRSFGGLGAYVESINGLTENPKSVLYWIFRINGVKSVTGISQTVLHGGETIQWVYEKMI